MPGPWDDRLVIAEPDPTAAIARALERAGAKVVGIHDGGQPGRTVSATYTYDCGCRRTYKADQRTHTEGEYLTACEAHANLVNLLTKGAEQATMDRTPEEAPTP